MSEKSIKVNMLWNSFGSLVYWGCQWLVSILVVRLSTGYSDAGALSLAMTISNVFVAVGLFKTRAYQVSDVQNRFTSGEYVSFRLLTLLFGSVISTCYVLMTCPQSSYLVIFVYLAFRASEVFVDVLHGVDQSHSRMDYCGISMALRGFLSLCAFSLVMIITSNLALSIVAMSFCSYPVLLLDWKWASSLEVIKIKNDLQTFSKLMKDCLPGVIGSSACLLVVTVSRQYLAMTRGEEILGIYASISTLTVLVQMASSYIYTPLIGSFASAYHDGDISLFRIKLLKVSACIVLIFAVMMILMLLFGEVLLNLLFGSSIQDYTSSLLFAVAAALPTAYIAFASDLLISIRSISFNMIINVLVFVISIPLTLLFVDSFGMDGVSASVGIAYGFGSIVMIVGMLNSMKSGA